MNTHRPIFTRSAECQDCYKCVRACPVKSIRVRDGHASVEPGSCIYCGTCVSVCPGSAKKIRDDLPRVRSLLKSRDHVYVSLAPSFVAEFAEATPAGVVRALRDLGFAGVSETAIGAELVSAEVDAWFARREGRLQISSACPVVVDLITKYYPSLRNHISPAASPMMAHAAYLRRHFGADIGVVFIGPCVAKKCEADSREDLVDAAITFRALRALFSEAGIDPAECVAAGAPVAPGGVAATAPQGGFVPRESTAGRLYPVDGGMTSTLTLAPRERLARCMHASGMGAVRDTLNDLDPSSVAEPLFLELLACDGGCVNGPGATRAGSLAARRRGVVDFAVVPQREEEAGEAASAVAAPLPARWEPELVSIPEVPEDEIRRALLLVGKRLPEDELNCGGCGYDSCREFARALVVERAEPAMCVAYMRRLAQKKNSALLKTMPSAAVTVDNALRIVESNWNFARLCGPDAEAVYEAAPGLEGALLERFVPQTDLFRAVLNNGGEIINKTLCIGGAIVNASIFSIEDHHLVGAILQDITDPAMRKQQIVEKSKEVIDKNLKTVQQIAYLLGENASETELILNSIVRSFSTEESVETRQATARRAAERST
ncbi:MAG: [Fe-Fe] hydrogenase large subunit C-terminal domain-containing protein [bacterium]